MCCSCVGDWHLCFSLRDWCYVMVVCYVAFLSCISWLVYVLPAAKLHAKYRKLQWRSWHQHLEHAIKQIKNWKPKKPTPNVSTGKCGCWKLCGENRHFGRLYRPSSLTTKWTRLYLCLVTSEATLHVCLCCRILPQLVCVDGSLYLVAKDRYFSTLFFIRRFLSEMFRKFDIDKSGFMETAEVKRALETMGVNMSAEV